MRKLKCIVNPAAGHGKARKVWPGLAKKLKELGVELNVDFTRSPGHAIDLTRFALQSGFHEIVAVGGDGTVNEVLNGFFAGDRLINPAATLGIVPRGTGADLVRSLAIPPLPEKAAEIIVQGRTRKIDVGRVHCLRKDGQPCQRYFLNVADLGYGGALVDRMNGYTKFLGSFLSYFVGLLFTLTFYRNEHLRIRVDDGEEESGIYRAIIAANGRYFGGGMWIAPEAQLDDGLLEFVLIGDMSRLEVIGNLARLYRGTLFKSRKVTYRSGHKLQAWSEKKVLVDTDGELPGKLPVTFEILPKCLRVFA